MTECKHAMIDLETMGTKHGAPIVSIGVVLFDPRRNKLTKNTFYRELDWEVQGRDTDKSTVEWWSKQSPLARDALYGLDDLEAVLLELKEWLPKGCIVWGNGATFDISILEHAYDKLGVKYPWQFWNVRDCRTVKDMYESKRGGFDKKIGVNAHNALADALYQAEYICMMWKSLLGGK